jgi:hypothetical protein
MVRRRVETARGYCRGRWYGLSSGGEIQPQHDQLQKSGARDRHAIHAGLEDAQKHQGQVRRRRKGVGPMTPLALARRNGQQQLSGALISDAP